MAWYPKARRREVTRFRTRMARPVRINYHTAVTNAASLYDWFNVWGRATSHFYIDKHGNVEQYIDTKYRAAADLKGNPDTISIETWDGYRNGAPGYWKHNGDVPPWTDAQMAALRDLTAWILDTHPTIPAKVATDSRPGSSSHGLSWHRLGIDGNFPGGQLKGRVSGGLKYSNARGKVCPGDRRIVQIPALISGVSSTSPTSPSVPEGHLDMHPDELNKHLSRHAENVVAQVTKNADDVIRQRDAIQNTALHNMVRRELAAAVAGIDLDLDHAQIADRIGVLLEDDVREAVADSIAEQPDRDATQVAEAVVDKIAHRLTTQED